MSNFAVFLGHTTVASAIGDLAQAGKRRQRPVDYAKHFTERDTVRWPQQQVAAEFPTTAMHDPMMLQIQENLLQELFRMFCVSAMSDIRQTSSGTAFARATSALSAYWAF